MPEPFVISHAADHIGWLTLNEPARLNPVMPERIAELNAACVAMSNRDDVKVVIVTGAGRGFCSGADLSYESTHTRSSIGPASGSLIEGGPGFWTLTAMRQPVIAMVNGAAVGYGAELAVQADIRVAGTSAKFRFPFSMLGTVSDTGAGSWLLPRLVGWSKAADLLYTSRFLSAEEAKEMGLVNYLLPDSELHDFTLKLAQQISANSTWSLAQLKRMLFAGLDQPKAAHILEQYFYFQQRAQDGQIDEFSARFKKSR